MLSVFKNLTKKQIAIAAVVASLTGAVGVVGVSQAAPAWKPSKAECAAAGVYKNYGQCVSEAAKNKNGYGG